MKRVFVVNEPLKTNRETGEKGRAIDLRPAQEFGELIFLSPPGEPPLDPAGWLPRMRELLSTFQPGDYLLPVGHPSLIVAAAAIIGELSVRPAHGGELGHAYENLCVLVWVGRGVGYTPLTLPLFPSLENQSKPVNPQSQENYNDKI